MITFPTSPHLTLARLVCRGDDPKTPYSRDRHIGGVAGPSSDKVVAAGQDKLPEKSGIPVQ